MTPGHPLSGPQPAPAPCPARSPAPCPARRRGRIGDEGGAAPVEFVIIFPLMFSLFLAAIDFGVAMLRQVFLERAIDIAVREVRLGRITSSDADAMRELICRNTTMLPNCTGRMTIEMRPIDTTTFDGLNDPFTCVNLQQPVLPVLAFNPGSGAQNLMLIRVCAAADPFLRLTGLIGGLPINPQGDYQLVARTVFVTE